MEVRVKLIDPNAKVPVKSKKGDLCFDVWAVSEREIAPNVWEYGLGFKYEIKREFPDPLRDFDLSIDLRPRSGIFKTGMSLANSEGTLDEFYRGEAKAIFYHVLPSMPRYKVGDRVGQVKVGLAPKVTFVEVDEINEETERGSDGFGSTGNK